MTIEEKKRLGTMTWADAEAEHVQKWKEAEARSGKPAWLRTLSDYDSPKR